ncbi:MAG: hypothetical protein RI958_2923 [Actinomycetota bacterium]|jgi:maleylacetate reductase
MRSFTHVQLPARVVFGNGARRQVAAEVDALHGDRVMLIAHGGVDDIIDALGDRLVLQWNDIVQHVPVDLAERARDAATAAGIDVIVTVGGGSATGLAKAIALTMRRPIVAVPTTYAGSEQTTIYGLTGERHKQTGTSRDVLPRVVVYDPELTVGIPREVTGPSAFNALAHSVEALYAPGNNPVIDAMSIEAIGAIHASLPTVMAAPDDLGARGQLLYGAYLSGVALGATSAAFHHKICHVLGGTFDLVHADAHSVILPHALAFNAPAIPHAMRLLSGVIGDDPAGALWDLAVASDVPTTLAALGLAESDLAEAAERAAAEVSKIAAPGNPRPCDVEQMQALLNRAFVGGRPSPGELA